MIVFTLRGGDNLLPQNRSISGIICPFDKEMEKVWS